MQRIAGWLCRRPVTPDPELRFCRRLLAAVILRAVEDAQRGDAGALAWLDDVGRQWCELLRIPAGDWQAAAARLPAARRAESDQDRAGYWSRYHSEHKDNPAYQERQRANRARYNAKRRATRDSVREAI